MPAAGLPKGTPRRAESFKVRELAFARRMSDSEALMWNVEKDPWLNPNGGVVIFLDQPGDAERFRRRIRRTITRVPRLRERVVPGFGRWSAPSWRTDAEFDFDHHLRLVTLPAPGTIRQLYDLATTIYEDPYDRTRPLWQLVLIDGLADGRGAVFWKTHHSITDGIGAVRLAEQYMDVTRDVPLDPEVDLERVIADAVAAEAAAQPPSSGSAQSATRLARRGVGLVGKLTMAQVGLMRKAAGETVLWPADPRRPVDGAMGAVGAVRSTLSELLGSSDDEPGGSPLWANRSRHRHLETVRIPLDDLKAAAGALGGTINDAFLAGITEGVATYHGRRKVIVDWFNATFVVSTRDDSTVGGNSFTPSRVQLPGGPMPVAERFTCISERVATKRAKVGSGSGALANLAGVANLLPTSFVTGVARAQAAKIDFATSNFRAAPFECYVAGAKVLENYPIGPVAGTAANFTALSYDGAFYIGILIDPVAVEDPGELRDDVEAGFAALLAAASPKRPRRRAQAP